jgi:hypothetical protein
MPNPIASYPKKSLPCKQEARLMLCSNSKHQNSIKLAAKKRILAYQVLNEISTKYYFFLVLCEKLIELENKTIHSA